VVIGRAARREARTARVTERFGAGNAAAALDLLELMELAWHDCYGESTPPEVIVDDVLLVSDGDLGELASAALLAVIDFRDLRLQADERRPR